LQFHSKEKEFLLATIKIKDLAPMHVIINKKNIL
jgi:hypothetical protein